MKQPQLPGIVNPLMRSFQDLKCYPNISQTAFKIKSTCPVSAFIVQVDYFRAVMRAKSREATPIGREGGRFYAYPASWLSGLRDRSTVGPNLIECPL